MSGFYKTGHKPGRDLYVSATQIEFKTGSFQGKSGSGPVEEA